MSVVRKQNILLRVGEQTKDLGPLALTPIAWFTVNDCYNTCHIQSMHEAFIISETAPLNSHILSDDEVRVAVVGFYLFIFKGVVPKGWTSEVGRNLWVYLYYNVKHAGKKLFNLEHKLTVEEVAVITIKYRFEQEYHIWKTNLGATSAKLSNVADVTEAVNILLADLVPTNSDQELCSFVRAIVENNLEERLTKLFLYFLRLAVKAPQFVLTYYNKHCTAILSWAGLSEYQMYFRAVSTKWESLAQSLTDVRDCITHHTVVVMRYDASAYTELKKWYVSRFEWFGLTLLTTLGACSGVVTPYAMLRSLSSGPNVTVLARILGAYVIYGTKAPNFAAIYNTIETIPTMTMLDTELGMFARCYSNKYLSWLTFNHNTRVSSLILGFASICHSNITRPEIAIHDDLFTIGTFVAESVIATLIADDPDADPQYKKAYLKLTNMKEQGRQQIAIKPPQVFEPTTTNTHNTATEDKDPFNQL